MLFTGKSIYGRVSAGVIVLLAAGAVATLAVPARAATDPRIAALFDWIDSNNDGRIAAAEFAGSAQGPGAGPFGALGLIVTTRVLPPPGESREALFVRLDTDRNGALTLGELDAGASARTVARPEITAADTNGDGLLTEGELAGYATARRAEAGDEHPAEGASLLARGIILEHDRDGDGMVPIADLVGG